MAALIADRWEWLGLVVGMAVGLGLLMLGQYLRFGDPFETGRFGHYSRWVAPWEGLAAQLVAPGRSFWLYSPALVLAAFGWPAVRRRLPIAAGFAVALVAVRWLAISGRSDWFGGWGVGPRHLVPVIPFALLGFAAAVEDLPRRRPWVRRLFWLGLAAAATLTALLATRSIFEWMWTLMRDPRLDGRPYLDASHWAAWASPIVGYTALEPDVLALGAIRLARLGHPGLLFVFVAIAAVGVAATGRVIAALWRLRVRAER